MSFAASWSGNKNWLSLCHNLPEGMAMSDDIQQQLKSQHGTRLIGWLLLHVMNTGNKGKMQMFYITFCARTFLWTIKTGYRVDVEVWIWCNNGHVR